MRRVAAALLLMLAPTVGCAGGTPSMLSAATSTLGTDDDGDGDDMGTTSASTISASASATATATAPSTATATATPDPSTGSGPDPSSGTTTDALTTTVGDPTTDATTSTGDSSSTTGSSGFVDLSGWSVVQSDSDRTLVLPAGTLVPTGGALVVGRESGQAAFEEHWGVDLGPDVVYINGGGDFPTINGDETYTLRDDTDTVVDGPSIALTLEESIDRVDPESGGAGAWTARSASVGTPTPGTSTEPGAGFSGAFVSEASDAIGNGNFVYEFVELRAFE